MRLLKKMFGRGVLPAWFLANDFTCTPEMLAACGVSPQQAESAGFVKVRTPDGDVWTPTAERLEQRQKEKQVLMAVTI